MSEYQFTPQAVDDLFEIWAFIARDNVGAANRIEEAVYEACELLAEGPFRGSVREDLTRLPVRFWVVQAYPTYFVVYDPCSDPLQIIRILHSSRAILAVLQKGQD